MRARAFVGGGTQIDVGEEMVGRTYGDLFARLALQQHLVPLGLFRRKSGMRQKPKSLFHTLTPKYHEEPLACRIELFTLLSAAGL